MPLQNDIQQAIKKAMIAKDADRLSTLRLLKSAIDYAKIDKEVDELSDGELITIVQKEVKKRRDAAEQFRSGDRPELAAKEETEIGYLEPFLPKALSPEELEALVKEVIAELGATSKKEMGSVIKGVQAKAAGSADGKSISSTVGKLLN